MSKINYWKMMTRRKPVPEPESTEDSKLGKVFGTFDLTALGVSATLGVGVYVLAGHVAKDQAGPSVILSFLIAAAASLLAGLCYAEFSSRVPKSGSAYIFTYVAIGEFVAFIVGWNLILEYIIGAASISKGLSLYIDSLIGDAMKNNFRVIAPISGDFLSSYFDFFAFGCPLVIGLALAFGLRKSAGINNVLCVLNLAVVAYVVVAVLFNADIRNWQINPIDIPSQYANSTGTGGFFPFGFSGTIKGAATCFFGFVGFDCIATTGEEVRNPQKTVPRALLFSLLIIFIAYFGVSLLTLMWPYYLLNPEAPLPHAFQEIGWISSMWVVTIGGIIGLLASLFGAMFPLPRILYAMAQDGLIFREFAFISSRFKTPVVGTLIAALLTSSFSALFDLPALVNMLSIGVLLAYTIVAISIIILRFSQSLDSSIPNDRYVETSNLLRPGYTMTTKGFMMQLVRMNVSRQPNTISVWVVGCLIICFCIVSFGLGFLILYAGDAVAAGETWALSIAIVFTATLVILCVLISIQPRQRFNTNVRPFKVPFVPVLPLISILVNTYLMLMLDCYTWIRFGVWMALGLLVYPLCVWIYNKTEKHVTENANDQVEEAIQTNGSIENGKQQKDVSEALSVNVSHETESAVTICENTTIEGSASDAISEDNDTNLAIEMLDNVLEAEEKSDMTKSVSSLNRINDEEILSDATITDQPTSITETMNPEIFDIAPTLQTPKDDEVDIQSLRKELEPEIDEILELALSRVELESANEADENVFKNQKFLVQLNDLISTKSHHFVSANTSQTLDRKSDVQAKLLKHSKSMPDFALNETQRNDVKNEIVDLPIEPKEKSNLIEKPSTPVFSLELIKKVETMRQREPLREETEKNTNISTQNEGSDKKNFRDKLEEILKNPPNRLSVMTPVPLPRTRILETSDRRQNSPIDTVASSPIPGSVMKHKEMFDEVLKKIKKSETSDENNLA